ncbi:Citrate-binding protein [Dichanthelium oligosanthes]|uniref:Citrate-binding protein n=1 Tax=Dichanthelium oligosanthes TaxID=888268 RepID=A0A1E5W3X1_9POAL|nr:Citrate-binding protein [Dichanthelium oligosanthes]
MASSSSLRSGSRHLRTLGDDGDVVRTAALLLGLIVLCVAVHAPAVATADGCNLTAGFVQVDLPEGNFLVQSPYDVAEDQRYSYDVATGVRTFRVYAEDKPFNTVTPTNPRTEVRLSGHDYSSGVWQFQGYGYVPSGTSGASVMQIHNEDAGAHATTMMLHVYNGTLRYYSGDAVEDDIYDRWFQLNVVHDVGASTVAVYVDGAPRLAVNVTPSVSHYFKFGVYMQHHDVSALMESSWRNVTVYTKPY